VRSGPEEGRVLPTKSIHCFSVVDGLHPASGVVGPWCRESRLELVPARVRAGNRFRGLGGLVFKGAETQESSGHQARLTPCRCERIRGGKKASKQVKLVKGAIPASVTQGDQEAGLRTRGKETHSPQGIQATARTRGSR